MKFTLEIEVKPDGETADAIYHWLCDKLFEIASVVDVTEIEREG